MMRQIRLQDRGLTWDDRDDIPAASLPTKFRMPDIERYSGIGCPKIHLRLYSIVMRAHGAIGCLLELHAPQRLLIICIIAGGGLEIRLFTQVDLEILEYSGKEVAIGEYSCRALNAGDHMHHHQISHVNPSPDEDRVHNKSLEVGDLVSMSSTWQENRAEHVVKDSAGHGQAVCRWFAHPLSIGKFAQPLNSLSRRESWHSGPRLGLIHSESN
ncbi:hypothetical protein VitviT2T_024618 [Vitis vinifera]|uniref:Uncharacterized protein n=1 Tax=Vitis vinifera TaxID=29760 RepID=A0ABY9DGA8_VITVI|nr:hypothetical protein VitviT2T_024618 [Vitis vinifera]